MGPLRIIGIALIVLGLMGLIFQGIPYKSEKDTIQLGPVQVTAEQKKSIAVPRILGGAALVGGIILLFVKRKR